MKRTITPIDRLLTATAELPATDRQRARQKRRGLYLRLLRQTLRTVALLKEDR
jgi:hypothetical protein